MVRHLAAGYDFLKETWKLGNLETPRGLGTVKRSSIRDGRSQVVGYSLFSIATRSAWQCTIHVEENAWWRELLPPVLNLRPGCIFSQCHWQTTQRLEHSFLSFPSELLILLVRYEYPNNNAPRILLFESTFSILTKNNAISFRNKKILLFQREREKLCAKVFGTSFDPDGRDGKGSEMG